MRHLIAFLGVLLTGVLLVCLGHIAPADVAVIATGLATLYTTWRGHVGRDDQNRKPRQ